MLGLTLYVPVLWPLLVISMVMMWSSGTGQGLHDLLARTVVVADPRVEPEQVEAFEAAALARHGLASDLVPPRYG